MHSRLFVAHPTARGFTLIEVLVATALFVTVALGSAHLFGLAVGHEIASRQQLTMGVLAARKIDELSAAAAGGALAVSPADALDVDAVGFNDVVVDAGTPFARRWRVSAVPGYPSTAVVMLIVRVNPPARGGAQPLEVATVREVGVW